MDFKQLESLCKVAELGSFTLAAEALFLSQPTVTAHIQALEKALGTRLFDRLGRRVVLTPAGEVLYQYARKMLALREQAKESLRRLDGLKGDLHLAASTLPGEYLLPRILPFLLREAPSSKISLKVSDSLEAIRTVEQNEAEVGIVGMKKEGDKLQFRPLFKDRIILAAPRSHPFAGQQVEWKELCQEGILTREAGSGTRRVFERALRQKGFNPADLRRTVELGSTTAVKEAIRAGLGIGMISDVALGDELGRTVLEVRLRGLGEVQRTFYLVTRRGRTLTPLAQRFVELVSKGQWTQGV